MYTVYTLRFPDGTRFVGLTNKSWERSSIYRAKTLKSANPPLYEKVVSSGGWDHVQWNVLGENFTKEEAYKLRKEYMLDFKAKGVWFMARRKAIPSKDIPTFVGNLFMEVEKCFREKMRERGLPQEFVNVVDDLMMETTQEVYDKYYRGEV